MRCWTSGIRSPAYENSIARREFPFDPCVRSRRRSRGRRARGIIRLRCRSASQEKSPLGKDGGQRQPGWVCSRLHNLPQGLTTLSPLRFSTLPYTAPLSLMAAPTKNTECGSRCLSGDLDASYPVIAARRAAPTFTTVRPFLVGWSPRKIVLLP